ncbi:hypothetical protein Cpir12675_004429 [Ceratocystis pirilliformis]|uniref:Bromo domain-containing protein n=1 Tax=Ceratocystis pirilliformis TaxID=259994 RepID=A0ABR3YXD0_9PEZI
MDPPELPPEAFTARESYFLFRAIHVFQTLDFTLLSKKLIANEFINGADEFDEARLTPRRLWGLFRHHFLAELPNPPTQLTPDLIVDKYKNITAIDRKLGEIYYTRLKKEVLSDAQREQEAAKRQADLEVEQKRIRESLLKNTNSAVMPTQLAAAASGVGISNAVPIAPASFSTRPVSHLHNLGSHGQTQIQPHRAKSPHTLSSASLAVSPLAAPGPEMATKKSSVTSRPPQPLNSNQTQPVIAIAAHQPTHTPRAILPATTQPASQHPAIQPDIQPTIVRPIAGPSPQQVLQAPGPPPLKAVSTSTNIEAQQTQFHQLPPKPPQPQATPEATAPQISQNVKSQQPQATVKEAGQKPAQVAPSKQPLEPQNSSSPNQTAPVSAITINHSPTPSADTSPSPQPRAQVPAALPSKSQSPQPSSSQAASTPGQVQTLKWERPYTPQHNTPIAQRPVPLNTTAGHHNGASISKNSSQSRSLSPVVSNTSQWTPNRFQVAHAPGHMPEQAQAQALAQAKAQGQVQIQAQTQAQAPAPPKSQAKNLQQPQSQQQQPKPQQSRPQHPPLAAKPPAPNSSATPQTQAVIVQKPQLGQAQQLSQQIQQPLPPLAVNPAVAPAIPSDSVSATLHSVPISIPSQSSSQPSQVQQKSQSPTKPIVQLSQHTRTTQSQNQTKGSSPQSELTSQKTPQTRKKSAPQATVQAVSGVSLSPQQKSAQPVAPKTSFSQTQAVPQPQQQRQPMPSHPTTSLARPADQPLLIHTQPQPQPIPISQAVKKPLVPISAQPFSRASSHSPKQTLAGIPEAVPQGSMKGSAEATASPMKPQPQGESPAQPQAQSQAKPQEKPQTQPQAQPQSSPKRQSQPVPVASTPKQVAKQPVQPEQATPKASPPLITQSQAPSIIATPIHPTVSATTSQALAIAPSASLPQLPVPQLQHNQNPPPMATTPVQSTKPVTSTPQPKTPFAKTSLAIPDHLVPSKIAPISTTTAPASTDALVSLVKPHAAADPQTPAPQKQALFYKRGHGTNWTLDSTPSTPGPANTTVDSPAWEPLSPPPPQPPPTPTLQSGNPITSTGLNPVTPGIIPSIKATPRRTNRPETPMSRGSVLSKRPTRTGRAGPPRTRRSQSIVSQPDELSMDPSDFQGPGSSRIKNEDLSKMEEAGDTTADEGITSRRRGPSSVRAGKRKRQDSMDSGFHRPRPSISTPTPAVQVGPPTHVRWTRGFPRVSASVLDQIGSHRDANMFANPIREKDAPNYSTIVLQAVDIASIKKAISHGNKIAIQAAAALPDGDPGTALVDLPISEDLVPPRGIINSEQLERSLVHMFCNAVMYNPDPDRGPGPAFLAGANHGGNGSENIGYQVDEFGVVNDTRNMFLEVDKLMAELRGAEMQRNGGSLQPPPVPTASSVSSGAATARAMSLATAGGGDDTDELDELAADEVASTSTRRSRRG